MKILQEKWGEIVIIPETENSSEFEFHLRSVRRINHDDKNEQELINELEPKEKRARRKFLILAKSMEYFFRSLKGFENPFSAFLEWERKNKMDWNEYYHWNLDSLCDEVNSYSFEYAKRSRHGWCI